VADGGLGENGKIFMNIVVDTNVLVAGLRSRNGASNALLHKIRDGKGFVLHLSTAAVLEYEEVLVRELVPSLSLSESLCLGQKLKGQEND
jgi:predicted nucleic acid-binding protein